MARYTLNKNERLKSRKTIKALFQTSEHVFHFPFKFVYQPIPCEDPTVPLKIAVTVSKKRFKSAVKRNLIKRRTREAYRMLKPELFEQLQPLGNCYAGMLIYVGNEIESFQKIETAMQRLMFKWQEALNKPISKKHP